MSFAKKNVVLYILWFQLLINLPFLASSTHYHFRVKEAPYTRLCNTKKILTVNGQFPGPTLGVYHGETIHVTVHNKGSSNITIHWHGVNQPRYPWTDGPAYITQCPIQPGAKFKEKIILSTEEGTLWWHAHSHWDRATVHGAIIVYPKPGTAYPFFKPHMEVPIILGEWWKKDVRQVLEESLTTGGTPNVSDAFTVNGQPGDLYPCSKSGTFKLNVDQGKIYLLRIINAAMNDILFFAIARHKLIVVGADGCYTKPLERKYITIAPGQTIDALLHANKDPNKDSHSYYMAARAYSPGAIPFDNTTTTAIIQYNNGNCRSSNSSTPLFPSSLPHYNNTSAAFRFLDSLRSIPNDTDHQPAGVPLKIDAQIVTTISINAFPCPKNQTCEGPNGTKLAASMNNISFANPSIDILDSYYKHIKGVFGKKFPSFPPLVFNFTAPYLPLELEIPSRGTQVKVLHYDSSVEIIFQGTNLVSGLDHPMHLHGYSFYVVGRGFGNFDKDKDPQNYNLIDPPLRNTVIVPINGWAAIRFRANNPGIWFMHCHLERHLTWGMNTVFLVKNGNGPEATLLPPPPDMPPC